MIRLLLPVALASSLMATEPVDLSGDWRFALDPSDSGLRDQPDNWRFPDTIRLPGMLTAQGFGESPSMESDWTIASWPQPDLFREWLDTDNFKSPYFLTPPRHYVGPAWYQREFTVPAEWSDRTLRVEFERVHWDSTLWINGQRIGRQDALGTPHVFEFGPLDTGAHTMTLRIDNRLDEVNPGPNAHSVSDHTQGNWNGIVGSMTLDAPGNNRIEHVGVFPSNDGSVRLIVSGQTDPKLHEASLLAEIRSPDASNSAFAKAVAFAREKDGTYRIELNAKLESAPQLWDEFDPQLYSAQVQLFTGDDMAVDEVDTTFGFREVENRNGILHLNGRRAFMRGTLECAIFPKTGHPPTDLASWERIIRICKDHGLNHMRFHSWCPPRAAFVAADRLGFYLQPEASAWAKGSAEVGSGRPVDRWINAETKRILSTYGNHPSFVFMAYGNEPGGPKHKEWLADWVDRQRSKDPRRLYTTAAGWPVMKGSDFHIPINPRIQGWGQGLGSIINSTPPSTTFDWRQYADKHRDAPIIAHEIGQWCAYPNFEEIAKYDGFFRAGNLEIFRETAERNGLIDQARDFLMASGKWQAGAYKHDIEAALRTPGFGGFQLLDLHDFPGQGTALVGVLDAFWDSKGYTSAEEFRRFCGPVVPLARIPKLVLTQDETLEAELELAHFGPEDFHAFQPVWTIADGSKVLATGELEARPLKAGEVHQLGTVNVNLSELPAPAKLTLSVKGTNTDAENSWDFFVYPSELPEAPEVSITRSLADTVEALEEGSSVLWLADSSEVADDPEFPLQIGFSPIFWNTAYTDWQPPHTLGLLNRTDHPALADFPTDTHSNWNWWEIVSRSRPFILTEHHELKPIVQPIDDWVTNRKLALVFEAKVGKGSLLACSVDLTRGMASRPAARQLLHSLKRYAASDRFQPTVEMSRSDLERLVRRPSRLAGMGAKAAASSAARGFEAAKAIDGNPGTLWHTPFGADKRPLPHELTVDLGSATPMRGVIITPRGDGNRNGRISEIRIYDDRKRLVTIAQLQDSARARRIMFQEPLTTTSLRLEISGSFTPPLVSIAEIDIVP
ncbi:beta-galactosidase [Haloferula helveola]|uniref:Beta-galactosidase n=1 Tax=Haloferula helveola TaxID=490095 RepID=A0ABN6H7S8_9BACT|nr:beta-galactosidase [Haloferula helveola]